MPINWSQIGPEGPLPDIFAPAIRFPPSDLHILAQVIAGFILILGFYYAPQVYARLKVLAATEKAKRGE
jgi:hypothetical protein